LNARLTELKAEEERQRRLVLYREVEAGRDQLATELCQVYSTRRYSTR
jgi:hypothetical protein